jgi:hypothetical protein
MEGPYISPQEGPRGAHSPSISGRPAGMSFKGFRRQPTE